MLNKPHPRLRVALCALFLFFVSFTLNAQTVISGSVTSSKDNAPVPSATVTVKGTKLGTQTNADGTFKITLPADKNVLVISAIGYDPQEVSTSGKTAVSVVLAARLRSLDEIVVTGYTSQKKKDITGAVAVVNTNDLKQVPVGTGEEALQGRASGVTIISSGQPGAASDIRIRGITGFGNNNPLVIVDGVQGNLHDINVNDIESLQVLKDASASIYGVRGSTGVILITTKRGKAGKAKVTYDAYYGVTQRGHGFDLASPQQEADAVWLAKKNSGLVIGDPNWGSKQYGKGATP
ncbi:MAG: TonB-dependent receptor plug domain-containing protein, partial [Bacteroidota bacterium]|nr:TonB-dependent receptor plug domain-containing protein [Bacteroidota bacterium]